MCIRDSRDGCGRVQPVQLFVPDPAEKNDPFAQPCVRGGPFEARPEISIADHREMPKPFGRFVREHRAGAQQQIETLVTLNGVEAAGEQKMICLSPHAGERRCV